MANEARTVEPGPNGGNPIDFTCFDGDSFEKGAIVFYSGTNNISGVSVDATEGRAIAGIVAAEKEAGDGALTVSVYQEGLFECKNAAGPALLCGDLVTLSGQNLITAFGIGAVSGQILGKVMEDTAASAWGTIKLMC